MTRELVTVRPDAPVAEVARVMREQRVHRVLVIDDLQLVGVLTTFDLLRAFFEIPRTFSSDSVTP
jgi:CBS domain-containing protein